jgi:GTPase
VPVSAVSGD